MNDLTEQPCPFCRGPITNFKPNYDIIELLDVESKPSAPSVPPALPPYLPPTLPTSPPVPQSPLMTPQPESVIRDFQVSKFQKEGGLLDGGPYHVRSIELGTGRSGWIKWKLILDDDGYYYIQCKQHNGYLDGGPNHIRPFEIGTGNSGWIKWKLIPDRDGYYFIQCKQHNGYLDGGPNNIRPFVIGTENSSWIRWKLKQKEDYLLIQCQQPVQLHESLFLTFKSFFKM